MVILTRASAAFLGQNLILGISGYTNVAAGRRPLALTSLQLTVIFALLKETTTRVNHATIVGFSCTVITGESTCMISLHNWFSRNIVSWNLAFDRADGFGSSVCFAIPSRSKHESNFTFLNLWWPPPKSLYPVLSFQCSNVLLWVGLLHRNSSLTVCKGLLESCAWLGSRLDS